MAHENVHVNAYYIQKLKNAHEIFVFKYHHIHKLNSHARHSCSPKNYLALVINITSCGSLTKLFIVASLKNTEWHFAWSVAQ